MVHQYVTPTEHRSKRIGGFSKGALDHLLGFGMRGSRVFHCSSVRSRVWRIPVLMQCGRSGITRRRKFGKVLPVCQPFRS